MIKMPYQNDKFIKMIKHKSGEMPAAMVSPAAGISFFNFLKSRFFP